MDGRTLSKLTQHISLARCNALIPGLYEAWRIAEVNTALRRAGWFSQVLEESVGLSATTEFASGSEYEGRTDLGNTQPGDGVRFKGRGFVQVTGRNHYRDFGAWCFKRRLVPSPSYFLDNPTKIADDRFAWISVAWYWIGNHNHGYDFLNKAADAKDLVAMTYMVNGGQNGFATRQYYYNRALALGNELMTPVGSNDPNWSKVMTESELDARITKIVDARIRAAIKGTNNKTLHAEAPALYVTPQNSVDGRLKGHNKRLTAAEKKATALEKAVATR